MLPLWLALAAAVVDSPCGLAEKALARDALAPTDVHLREAATHAEAAGDTLWAMKLLAQLKYRSRDDDVIADATFMLETLDPRGDQFNCHGATRDDLVYVDPTSLVSDADQRKITEVIEADLDHGNVTAVFDTGRAFEDCIDLDDRCVRLILSERKLGGVMRVRAQTFDRIVSVESTTVGFKGRAEHRIVLDEDNRRWRQILGRHALDAVDALMPAGASRGQRQTDSAFGPALAGATAIGLGLVLAGVGTAVAIEPGVAGLVGVTPRTEPGRERLRLIGFAGLGVGAAVVIASSVATALIVDARNDG